MTLRVPTCVATLKTRLMILIGQEPSMEPPVMALDPQGIIPMEQSQVCTSGDMLILTLKIQTLGRKNIAVIILKFEKCVLSIWGCVQKEVAECQCRPWLGAIWSGLTLSTQACFFFFSNTHPQYFETWHGCQSEIVMVSNSFMKIIRIVTWPYL